MHQQSERVAQAVEHVTFNHGVEGSSPSALTKQIKYLQLRIGFDENRGTTYGTTIRDSLLWAVFRRCRQGRKKRSADHAGSRTAPIIETMIEILAPASPVARGMVTTDDDIEFDEADLARYSGWKQ